MSSLSRELSAATLRTLKRRDYLYDASTFPTFLGPLARAYYFFNAKLTPEERAERKLLFGGFREGLRPVDPYHWQLAEGPLMEVPVTTMPLVRAPFHLSYAIYLAGYSPALAKSYFRIALAACRAFGVQPSLLLHPLDFLGGDDVDALAFFPGMNVKTEQKLSWVAGFLSDYSKQFSDLPMNRHVESFEKSGKLPLVEPRFSVVKDISAPVSA